MNTTYTVFKDANHFIFKVEGRGDQFDCEKLGTFETPELADQYMKDYNPKRIIRANMNNACPHCYQEDCDRDCEASWEHKKKTQPKKKQRKRR